MPKHPDDKPHAPLNDEKLLGPLYSPDTGHSLGPEKVGGPTGGKETPDPLGFNKAKRNRRK